MNRADYTLSSPATSLGAIAMLAAGIVIALLVHWLFFWFAQRVVRRTRREADDAILAALYQPARWLIALIGFGAALAPIRLGPTLSGYWTIGGRILFAALVGWMALSLVGALRHIVELRSDISVADNLRARRRRARGRILHRIAQLVIGFITVSVMLVAIPDRQSGGEGMSGFVRFERGGG